MPTGQKIYFRGADDPLKIKSIKPEFGYIGILWLEELDQFAGLFLTFYAKDIVDLLLNISGTKAAPGRCTSNTA